MTQSKLRNKKGKKDRDGNTQITQLDGLDCV